MTFKFRILKNATKKKKKERKKESTKGKVLVAQSAGAVEYTDCFSAEEYDPPPHHECHGYDTKQSDSEVP